MASNRLYIFDPETKKAICIAKGYSEGWSNGKDDYIDDWLGLTREPTVGIVCTRLRLMSDGDLPRGAEITYEPE